MTQITTDRVLIKALACSIVLLAGCQFLEKPRSITIVMDGDRAIGIDIPGQLLRDHDRQTIQVSLAKEGERTAILGEFIEAGHDIRFLPLVPLTLGNSYDVVADGEKIGSVQVPESEEPAPELVGIYPLADTVPENLLKFYFQFSQSMREGRSASNIHLTNSKGDTMNGTFLDLQPELWNEDATVLTLWLDPGRIKLDLIPNKEMGNPLSKGETYVLHVSSYMESKKSKYMVDEYSKTFFVSDRDDRSPAPKEWQIDVPGSGTTDPLNIFFHEPLDHELALNTMQVFGPQGEFPGTFTTQLEDAGLLFNPSQPWAPGTYSLIIGSRLEDLAGNNLNRLFERDLLKEKGEVVNQKFFTRKFRVD